MSSDVLESTRKTLNNTDKPFTKEKHLLAITQTFVQSDNLEKKNNSQRLLRSNSTYVTNLYTITSATEEL